MQLEGHDLRIGYSDKTIIKKLNIKFPEHQIIGLIGPNGGGKSTLLNVLSGFRQPQSGEVILNGKNLKDYSPKKRARVMASLPQSPKAPSDTLVHDLVSYGRYAYQRPFHGLQESDEAAIHSAIRQTNMEQCAACPLADLSGGLRQRAFIAMTLAQNSEVLLLDEPTTYLDLTHQLEILQLLKKLNQTEQKTIIMVLHDLNQAARFCDSLICLRDGEVLYQGHPSEVFTEKMLADVFNIQATVRTDPEDGCPMIVHYDTNSLSTIDGVPQ